MSKARGPYMVDPLGYKKKAMQQAMEALKESIDVPCYGGHPKQEAAYHALQEALANEALDKKAENARELGLDYEPAQQEFVSPGGGYVPAIPAQQPAQQEPATQRAHEMALRQWERWKQYAIELQEKLVKYEGGAPMVLNTSPPSQRTWVGLTDEEIEKEWVKMCGSQSWARHKVYARNIEAALKSKNT